MDILTAASSVGCRFSYIQVRSFPHKIYLRYYYITPEVVCQARFIGIGFHFFGNSCDPGYNLIETRVEGQGSLQ